MSKNKEKDKSGEGQWFKKMEENPIFWVWFFNIILGSMGIIYV